MVSSGRVLEHYPGEIWLEFWRLPSSSRSDETSERVNDSSCCAVVCYVWCIHSKKQATIYILKAVSFFNIYSVLNLPPVVQTLDSTIHRIKIYSGDNAISSPILIHWIVIHPVDSAIQRLNNRVLVDSAIQPLYNRGQKVKGSTPTGSIWIFSSEVPESLTESNIFLMYSLGLKFTTTFPSEFYPVLTFLLFA